MYVNKIRTRNEYCMVVHFGFLAVLAAWLLTVLNRQDKFSSYSTAYISVCLLVVFFHLS